MLACKHCLVCQKYQIQITFLNFYYLHSSPTIGLSGWTPVPPAVYIKAKQEREKLTQVKSADDPEDEPEIEKVLPKKLPF